MDQKDWGRAGEYWQRYLWLEPEDIDARLELIKAYRQNITTPRDRRRLTSILYYTIGRAPERIELRLQLAENLLELGDFKGADAKADEALEKLASATNDAANAQGVKDLAPSAGALRLWRSAHWRMKKTRRMRKAKKP